MGGKRVTPAHRNRDFTKEEIEILSLNPNVKNVSAITSWQWWRTIRKIRITVLWKTCFHGLGICRKSAGAKQKQRMCKPAAGKRRSKNALALMIYRVRFCFPISIFWFAKLLQFLFFVIFKNWHGNHLRSLTSQKIRQNALRDTFCYSSVHRFFNRCLSICILSDSGYKFTVFLQRSAVCH